MSNRFVFKVPEAGDELVSVAADSLSQAVERLKATLAARGVESRCSTLQWAESGTLPASEVRSYEPSCVLAYRKALYAVRDAMKLAPEEDRDALYTASEALEDLLLEWKSQPHDEDNDDQSEVSHG